VESAEPPWRRGSTAASSSSLISREELDGERASVASSPWKAPKYIDATFETMLRRRGLSKGIPDRFQDSIRDMCHHAYGAWETSLREYVWPNVVKAVNEEVKRRAGTEEGPCSLCGGEWADTGGNMRHNLFECAALHIYDKCPFGPHRWESLLAHPFTLPRGGVNITEVMRYFGSLLEVWVQHTKSRMGQILVWGKGYSFAQGSLVQGQMTESALRALARDYRNQRTHVQRNQMRRGEILQTCGRTKELHSKAAFSSASPTPRTFSRAPTVRQKRMNPEPANDTDDEADERYSAKYQLFKAVFSPEDRPKGSAAAAHALQGFPDHSQAPPLASNVATSTVARADSACPIEGVNRTAAAKAPRFAPPPPLRQGQRERAAHSVLVPSPHVPIHGQKRRNSEQANENGDEEPGGFSVKRRRLVPPPPVPLHRRCPAKRSSSLFTRELCSKKHATLAVPPPTKSR
jgi:hypothetical protein